MLAGGNIFKYSIIVQEEVNVPFSNSRASSHRDQKGCGEVEGVENGFGVVFPINYEKEEAVEDEKKKHLQLY